MIRFITNREDHNVTLPSGTIEQCVEHISKLDIIGLDTENSSLFPHHAVPLLLQLGNEDITWVIDTTSVDISFLNQFKDYYFLGQNLKYDYEILKAQFNIELRNLKDLMLIEQTLGMGAKRKNSLDAIIERRLGTKATYQKSTRNEFINANSRFIFEDRHIIYAADDIKYLRPIYNIDMVLVDKFDMRFVLEEIEFPLIPILGDCELEGMNLNREQWEQNILDNTRLKYELEQKLDEELKRLGEGKETLSGGKFSRTRKKMPQVIQTGLWGDTEIEVKNKANINYGSPQQIKDIFTRLGKDVPVDKNGKESIGTEILQQYKQDPKNKDVVYFISLLLKYSEVCQQIDAFGKDHLNMISPKTGKIHTIYRQCSTVTGRFQSGNSKAGFFNSQQIPKDNKYRTCFYSEGYNILTIDLASAELVILAALSEDKKLVELQKEDIHSYLATVAYNKLIRSYKRRIIENGGLTSIFDVEELQELLSGKASDEKLSETDIELIILDLMTDRPFTISKKEHKWLRDRFKSVVYGLA